ncbi:MAG TPA: diaminopimelate decarboxylase [Elusimicrobia bacterium]|nr:MAG: diaminopimelate decarboxylase [Elusimicrobia bacterium GWD2_63_28]HCC48483.1 diaminopimelate decarboxylase [Elusimicrobiota bacterium]
MLSKYFKPALLKQIAAKAGTPTYVYSQAVFLKQVNAYAKAFKGLDPLFCYAMKANSSGTLCALAAERGWGADVVSGGELFRALRAGFQPGKIIFSGVGKTPAELEYALKTGIMFVNAESFEEVQELERVAARLKLRAPLSLRINPDVDPHTHKYISTGLLGSKFGVSFEEALKIYMYAAESKHLQPVGAQFHIGSQVHSAAPYALAAGRLAAFMVKLASRGVNLKYADVGGGWGVKEGGEMADPSALAKAVGGVFGGTGLKLVLEPGRSVAAPCGLLLSSVIYRKTGGKKNFIIADAAMNDLVRPALYGAKHPAALIGRGCGPKRRWDIVGPVCESGDFLAQGVTLPEPAPGQLLAIYSAGAYGFSMSSQYNSRPRAAEVLITGPSSWRLIRRRETYADLVAPEPKPR